MSLSIGRILNIVFTPDTPLNLKYLASAIQEHIPKETASVRVSPHTIVIEPKVWETSNGVISDAIEVIGLLSKQNDQICSSISEFILLGQYEIPFINLYFSTASVAAISHIEAPFRWIIGDPENSRSEPDPWENLASLAIDCLKCEPDYINQILEIEPSEVILQSRFDFETCYYHMEDCDVTPDELLAELARELESCARILIESQSVCETYFKFGWFLKNTLDDTLELTLSPCTFCHLSKFECDIVFSAYLESPESHDSAD